MAKTKTFRIFAKVTSYCYHDVEAKSIEQAEELVQQQIDDEDLDAGDFIPCDKGGEFTVPTSDIPTQELK